MASFFPLFCPAGTEETVNLQCDFLHAGSLAFFSIVDTGIWIETYPYLSTRVEGAHAPPRWHGRTTVAGHPREKQTRGPGRFKVRRPWRCRQWTWPRGPIETQPEAGTVAAVTVLREDWRSVQHTETTLQAHK